ncbi:hypothetical protein K0M31_006363 [Melipona bicolor]|uniref:Uncharacterized protein n=1 Tax=Melipona bicolor TaxID=60889 RepID=A0AA40FU48_9HYME|nr:hypothetical protein K0M31_006363 [Melipona bicolor]
MTVPSSIAAKNARRCVQGVRGGDEVDFKEQHQDTGGMGIDRLEPKRFVGWKNDRNDRRPFEGQAENAGMRRPNKFSRENHQHEDILG